MVANIDKRVTLKPEVKTLWLERLRSGQDGQCSNKLGDGQGNYCCLGVLSQIAVEQGVIDAPIFDTYENSQGETVGTLYFDQSSAVLPLKVARWAFEEFTYNADIDHAFWENPAVRFDIYKSLAELNDAGYAFPAIANVIEDQL